MSPFSKVGGLIAMLAQTLDLPQDASLTMEPPL